MTSDPAAYTVEILTAYLHALRWLLPASALFDLLCWVGIWLWWRRRDRAL